VSDQQPHVTMRGKSILVPTELYNSMRKPKYILLSDEDTPALWMSAVKVLLFSVLILASHRIYRAIFHRPRRYSQIFHFSRLVRENAEYNGKFVPGDAEYNIVNYHPNYYLIPVDLEEESKSREAFWSKIHSYHEHLDPASQEADAHRVSEWLAREIMRPLGAHSFLELGCGSGRNLLYISREIPAAEIYGLDINPEAVAIARDGVKKYAQNIVTGSLYDTQTYGDESIDIVFTSGVLMHVPHGRVQAVIKEMYRIARLAVVNFELHGPRHAFDYHRYPRDYAELYAILYPNQATSYKQFQKGDYRTSGTSSFNHALLVCTKRDTS
jgi:ubiquinone/menaquinone biosynthesis C-methylase UbiE